MRYYLVLIFIFLSIFSYSADLPDLIIFKYKIIHGNVTYKKHFDFNHFNEHYYEPASDLIISGLALDVIGVLNSVEYSSNGLDFSHDILEIVGFGGLFEIVGTIQMMNNKKFQNFHLTSTGIKLVF